MTKNGGDEKSDLHTASNGNANSQIHLQYLLIIDDTRLLEELTLFFIATTQAVTCSAAFPTMGNKIKPTKVLEICAVSTMLSILSTKYSAQTATNKVMMTRSMEAVSG